MNFIELIKMALAALQARKLRSFLTILGIVIGITSVVMVFSAGEGFTSLIHEQIDSWGADTIEVEVKVPSTSQTSSENASGMALGITITTLKESDAEAVSEHPNITDVYAGVTGQAIVVNGSEKDTVNFFGVSSSFPNIDSGKIEEGRFFTDQEDKSLARVVILGSEVKDKLFGDSDAIGRYIKVGRNNFKVIGIMEKRGAVMFMNMDEWIYLPLRTSQKLIMGIDHISFILGKLKDTSLGDITTEDITLMLRDRHGITDPIKDDFAVVTMEEAKEMLDSILGGVTLLLIAIAGISLIVGGVGIMNIMYVSVSERINEIGLRKAIGATKSNILMQFLAEAVILTFIGGVIGIIMGVLLSYGIYKGAQAQGFDWHFVIQPISLVIAVGFSVVIGIVFGLYPAKKAAEMDPIKALGHE